MNLYKKKLIEAFNQKKLTPNVVRFGQTCRESVGRYLFIAERIKNLVRENVYVLGAGCWLGAFLISMTQLGHNCTALDYDGSYYNCASGLLDSSPLHESNLETSKLSSENESFDFVFAASF
jgi:2-polyprenyl-3-methyl-5-hydroxy-6-metoxy-1,4-benzoquinol methylase